LLSVNCGLIALNSIDEYNSIYSGPATALEWTNIGSVSWTRSI